jgi:CDP-glucose 4,6-dehydratase
MVFAGEFFGRRVLVTGHTGFKGSWLCEWLLSLGAEVGGLGLKPGTDPALFTQLGLATRLKHFVADVRNASTTTQIVDTFCPEFVFHLAAQPLVRKSYADPVETYATNVMGTVNLLEAIRQSHRPCIVVVITTDKCYENREWVHGYREEDPLGGYDPYSSSKGAAELVVSAYRRSFFSAADCGVRLASARAGNVLGGGDWAADRIVPDCVRSLRLAQPVPVRNKRATRPWQHVLEPLGGYLWLAAKLAAERRDSRSEGPSLAGAYNFGPPLEANRTVLDLVQEVLRHWPGGWIDQTDPSAVHEAGRLNLSTDKAFHLLQWSPAWTFERSVAQTITWYREVLPQPSEAAKITRAQIATYENDAVAEGIAWAMPAPSILTQGGKSIGQ